MSCPANNDRQPCTRQHPGYVGDLPADPSDAAFINLLANTPYVGYAAGLLGSQMLKGGPVCIEDARIDLRTNWNKIFIAGAVSLGLLAVALFIIRRK